MYVWQREDWTERWYWDEQQCLGPLSEARLRQGRLLGKGEALGLDLGIELQVTALVDEAVTTSAIEGESLDREPLRSSVARRLGMPHAGLPPVKQREDGLVQVLMDATGQCNEPLTSDRLKSWQAALFPTGYSGIRKIVVGAWRKGPEPMQVVSGRPDRETVHYEAPPTEAVDAEVERFLRWWGSSGPPDDGLLRAALAHLWFVTIHPFEDGNGRIARAVADMALAQDEGTQARLHSMSAQIAEERKQYYAELQRAQGGDGDVTDWFCWFLGCIGRAMRRAEQEVDRVLAKARFWHRVRSVPINERQLKVVNRLLDAGPGGFEGGITTRKYVALTRTSRATAQREIADLVSKGLLVPLPGGGRSSAYEIAWRAVRIANEGEDVLGCHED